jgi:hypothetical protein
MIFSNSIGEFLIASYKDWYLIMAFGVDVRYLALSYFLMGVGLVVYKRKAIRRRLQRLGEITNLKWS